MTSTPDSIKTMVVAMSTAYLDYHVRRRCTRIGGRIVECSGRDFTTTCQDKAWAARWMLDNILPKMQNGQLPDVDPLWPMGPFMRHCEKLANWMFHPDRRASASTCVDGRWISNWEDSQRYWTRDEWEHRHRVSVNYCWKDVASMVETTGHGRLNIDF